MKLYSSNDTEVLDVLIIGAGISGIGCAAYLRRELPGKNWKILEMRSDLGGTWDLFRYPGIRSDSDLYTFSYEFKPWRSRNAIAGADEIKAYIAETANEYDIYRHIDFRRKVVSASWNSATGLWTVTAENLETGERELYVTRWIFSASVYYDYDEGYRRPSRKRRRSRGSSSIRSTGRKTWITAGSASP